VPAAFVQTADIQCAGRGPNLTEPELGTIVVGPRRKGIGSAFDRAFVMAMLFIR
jgi:hypothetical protein